MLNWIKLPKKIFSLLSVLSECFEEILIGDDFIKITLNKRVIIDQGGDIIINSKKSITFNANKLYANPIKISAISAEDLEKLNNVQETTE